MKNSDIRPGLKLLLDQAHELVVAVDDHDYTRTEPVAMDASIGGHLRHVIEHIEPILDTPAEGILDYDARPRDREVENSRLAAKERVNDLCKRLDAQNPEWETHGLRVRNRVSTGENGSPVVTSSRARELMYAVAHTVHHYALIAIICRLRGIELSPDFGFAPSTLEHRQTTGNG
jgi:uncharacterized damage-inducible protein DinB